jgi:small neutral amino acid transporter SnatA (MarC family)
MSAIDSSGTPSPDHADPHDDHGSTPAAWTAVTIITIAFVVGTLAIILANWVMFWVGVGLVVVGAIVGRVMQAMGMGKALGGPHSGDRQSSHGS